MRHLLLAILLAGLLPAAAFTQAVPLSLYKRFNASIITQVYEISKEAHLKEAQQWKLAVLLNRKDSVIADMLLRNNSLTGIAAYSAQAWQEIRSIDGIRGWYDSLAAGKARLAARQEYGYYQKYKPSRDCQRALERLLYEKQYQLALLTEVFPGNGKSYNAALPGGDSAVRSLITRQDSLAEAELIRDGVFISSSQFIAAVRMRRLLRLTPTQTDSLIERGQHLAWRRDSAWNVNPMIPFDTKDYENYYLSLILTEDQYSSLLAIRYRHDAEINAANDLKDLVKRGLVKENEKETALKELITYYISLKSSSNLYAYDLNKQSAYARGVKDGMPKCLKTLQYARSHNITAATPATAVPAATMNP